MQVKLQEDIKWIQSELQHVTDPELILAFKNLLKYRRRQESKDWWNEISTDEQNEINEGIQQADNNELIDHDEIKKSYSNWL